MALGGNVWTDFAPIQALDIFFQINQQRSSSLDTNRGITKGLTHGQLLFILYINDWNKSVTRQKSIHYSEDTTFYHTSLISSELGQIRTWINENELSLNVKN